MLLAKTRSPRFYELFRRQQHPNIAFQALGTRVGVLASVEHNFPRCSNTMERFLISGTLDLRISEKGGL